MEYNGIDRLSILGHSTLECILSKLTTAEVVRTSVLSKRFLEAWEFTPALDFDGLKTEDDVAKAMSAMKSQKMERIRFSGQLGVPVQKSAEGLVENVGPLNWLQQRQLAMASDMLEVKVGKRIVNDLLALSLRTNVEELLLNVKPQGGLFYTVPNNLFSSGHLRMLELSNCRIDKVRNAKLERVKSLALVSIDAENKTIRKLISACSNVLVLKLTSVPKLSNLEVSLEELRHLEINGCSILERIRLNSGKLRSIKFNITSESLDFCIGECPYLQSAEVSTGLLLQSEQQKTQLLLAVGQANVLILSCPFRRKIPPNLFEGTQQCFNVTRLDISSSTSAIVALLSLFPRLEDLTVRSHKDENIQGILDEEIGDYCPKCAKETLTTVTIAEFRAYRFQMRIAQYLARNSHVLKHMWLDEAVGKFSIMMASLMDLQPLMVSPHGVIALR